MPNLTIHTIGHSTRPIEDFLELLDAHRISLLADVRRFPASRRHPHYNAVPLRRTLESRGIGYLSLSDALGGRRNAFLSSPNTGWKNDSFRGYADYMSTSDFAVGISQLIDAASAQPAAIMCAEALPWQCHRNLISDALVLLRHCEVLHIMSATDARPHTPPSFAVADHGVVRYPADDLLAGQG
jgi:uncharacterized protein (DUF488 family)